LQLTCKQGEEVRPMSGHTKAVYLPEHVPVSGGTHSGRRGGRLTASGSGQMLFVASQAELSGTSKQS